MDELITKHSAIMDKFDPEKKVGLMVDEWGTWYTGLPGVNPGFLHQQNSLRDALVAAIHLNIFSQHADRVKMANIAQMVNVLQAMILTQRGQDAAHADVSRLRDVQAVQGRDALPLEISAPNYQRGEYTVPAVHASAARGKDGKVHVALTNLDPNSSARLTIRLEGVKPRAVTGQILTADAMNAINTFEKPR